MKRFSAGLVLMLLCTFSIFAQNKVITVSGRVVESDTKEPAAQATVQLLSLPDSAYAAGIGMVYSPQSKSRKICVESFLYWIPNQARTGTIIC